MLLHIFLRALFPHKCTCHLLDARQEDPMLFFLKAKAAPLHYQLSISKSTQDCNYGFLLAAHCLRYHPSLGKVWVLPTLRIQLGIKTRKVFIYSLFSNRNTTCSMTTPLILWVLIVNAGATETSFLNQDLFGFCLVITDTTNNFTIVFIHIGFFNLKTIGFFLSLFQIFFIWSL